MEYIAKDWYWQIGSDATQVYSSKRATLVAANDDIFTAWRATGCDAQRIASMEHLVSVLTAAGVPPYHTVKSYHIVRRLESCGPEIARAALAILDAPENAVLKARFYTLDGVGGVPAQDADARRLIVAVGADPEVILAPD